MKFKFFLISLLLSLPFWWSVNVLEKNLEDFLFQLKITYNPQILIAQISAEKELESLKPIRNRQIEDLEIFGESAISVLINEEGEEKILFEKEKEKKMPIASLAKLMTAKIALDNYDFSQPVEISQDAVEEKEESGNLKIGEIFTVQDLLYPLLMESSNDAAVALTEIIGQKAFVDLMNLEAENLEMSNTYFDNPTGLDNGNRNPAEKLNYSSVEDLAKLTKHLLEKYPLLWKILSTSEHNLYSPEGVFHHRLKNTNQLLTEITSFSIVGGKTGETPQSGGCLLLVIKAPQNKGYLINVILNSDDRFSEMKKTIEWLNSAYRW